MTTTKSIGPGVSVRRPALAMYRERLEAEVMRLRVELGKAQSRVQAVRALDNLPTEVRADFAAELADVYADEAGYDDVE